jgi:hypothetical protein
MLHREATTSNFVFCHSKSLRTLIYLANPMHASIYFSRSIPEVPQEILPFNVRVPSPPADENLYRGFPGSRDPAYSLRMVWIWQDMQDATPEYRSWRIHNEK